MRPPYADEADGLGHPRLLLWFLANGAAGPEFPPSPQAALSSGQTPGANPRAAPPLFSANNAI
jgi:hypothetical protein